MWGFSYQWLHGVHALGAGGIAVDLVGLVLLVPSWRRDLTDRFYPVPLALPLTIA